ncbi:MAG: hypothetical protein JW771_01655 [Candidatus Thermoplasmatota archaeon]|jgi:hypothetical protein|nr:hypothetical protein [Candidatus Thermoplasmatota archaeon]
MTKDPEMELTQGSRYKILSLGGRDRMLETAGTFKGFMTIGVEEIGLLMELNETHGDMEGKIRIVPLHAILAIDVLEAKPNEKPEDDKQFSHYVG